MNVQHPAGISETDDSPVTRTENPKAVQTAQAFARPTAPPPFRRRERPAQERRTPDGLKCALPCVEVPRLNSPVEKFMDNADARRRSPFTAAIPRRTDAAIQPFFLKSQPEAVSAKGNGSVRPRVSTIPRGSPPLLLHGNAL